jgi:serine/threonine protein phosphatase PrpC
MPRQIPTKPPVEPIVDSYTHIGARDQQEDRYGVETRGSLDQGDRAGIAIVADGLGGHYRGDLAAQEGVDTLVHAFKTEDLFKTVPDPARRIECREFPPLNPDTLRWNSGTTLVALVWRQAGSRFEYRLMSVGDSYGLAIDSKGLAAHTRIEGVGGRIEAYWGNPPWGKFRLWMSDVRKITRPTTFLLASDGIDPITGNLVQVIRNGEDLSESSHQFLNRVRSGTPLETIASEAIKKEGVYADNTTMIRLRFPV